MDAKTIERLEQKIILDLEYKVSKGFCLDCVNMSQTLVNIAMYRRLAGGDKIKLRADGAIDMATK